MGYVLKKVNPLATYVAIDLPEGLLISSTRLPRLLPGYQVVDYLSAHNMAVIDRPRLAAGSLWFLGSHHLPKVAPGTFDVLINLASFQEMTATQVSAYLNIVDARTAGYVYLLEYWNEPALASKYGSIVGYGDYVFPRRWSQMSLRNSPFSPRYFETLFRVNPVASPLGGTEASKS